MTTETQQEVQTQDPVTQEQIDALVVSVPVGLVNQILSVLGEEVTYNKVADLIQAIHQTVAPQVQQQVVALLAPQETATEQQ